MTIKHNPITDITKIEKIYTEKDGVPVKYICTTDFRECGLVADIFYRETPHPTYGNCYFGVYYYLGRWCIANADIIEDLQFGMIENDEGQLEYSEARRIFKQFENGNFIDGGRTYIRSNKLARIFYLKDGEFKEIEGCIS